jgi:preprotein translocase subunit SecA
MFLQALKSFLPKGYNARQLRKLHLIVAEVEALEPDLKSKTDSELQAQTAKLRTQVQEELDDGVDYYDALEFILPEAFATVREAARRILGERHYTCQLAGGIALFRGIVVEMRTGEGKTLVSTLPVYLHGLMGRGVHVVTVNDYLSKRDSEWMGAVHKFLGLSVGLIHHNQEIEPKGQAYRCDITYGTNNEFGFDYLRDHMAGHKDEIVQRLNYCIIDEVDSVLIDEARTPLIISGPAERSTELYLKAAQWVLRLSKDSDYKVDEKAHGVYLTDEGIAHAEKIMGVDNLYAPENLKHLHHLEASLKAKELFNRDQQYVVKDNQVLIIDEFTGRLMPGRRYSDGLHGAIEAKEGVPVANESMTLASITFQNFFRLYQRLAGMTGTAMTEVTEFGEIYDLDALEVPTNQPMVRQDLPDLIFKTQKEKFEAIAAKSRELHEKGQPVLIGTISIENSEKLAAMLTAESIPHTVLNAKHHEQEAEIVASAGQRGGVTIATNMAGRGTDIKLGEEVASLGGLYIIGSERHESRRIDNQLRGRSGRQGDTGTSQFYLSLEDDLMRIFGGDRMTRMMNFMNWEYGEVIDSKMVTKALENAQRRVESMHFEARKHILKYDNVLNEHRTIIYTQRSKALREDDLREDILFILENSVQEVVSASVHEEVPRENWDYDEVSLQLKDLFHYDMPSTCFDLGPNELQKALYSELLKLYEEKEARFTEPFMRHIERAILLQTVDTCWKEHLTMMDHLKEGIGLRGYGQRDPLVEYKLEATELFNQMIRRIKEDTVSLIFKLDFDPEQELEMSSRPDELQYSSTPEEEEELERSRESKQQPLVSEKVGRNDPCPCGSGKKYKKCHGR